MNPPVPTPASFAAHPGWRTALPTLIVVLAVILVLFRETALAMATIWARSDTYAHGFIVPPITLWLIWRIRSSLAVLAPKPSYLAVLLFAGAGFAWFLGELAAVNVIPQFALVFMLVLAVPAVLGWKIARRMTFPLLFLFFAVPFGEFATAKLMDWTAYFTILGLRFSGIPVLSEGLRFVIPTGSWSVVEACSGIRYLIASVTVGTLFAYLTYYSLRRRLLFVAAAIIVPIIANWARAYMIVMIGHLSGNTLAVGVDHLIYGWVFFGMVIMAMFWIGALWREDEPAPEPEPAALSVLPDRPAPSSWGAALATVLVGSLWVYAQWQMEHDLAPPITQLRSFGQIAGWQSAPQGIGDWQPGFVNPAASMQMNLQSDGRLAGLFLAYYRNQDQQRRLVSSTNALVTGDDHVWTRITGGTREISFNQQVIKVRTAVLSAGDGKRLLVWQWYWVNGRWTASDALAKAYTVLSRLTGKGDDSAVIILYAPQSQAGGGEAALEELAGAAAPVIEKTLQQTAAAR